LEVLQLGSNALMRSASYRGKPPTPYTKPYQIDAMTKKKKVETKRERLFPVKKVFWTKSFVAERRRTIRNSKESAFRGKEGGRKDVDLC